MVKKAEQDVIDKRLEDTLDLFQPTARQEKAAAEIESKATRQAPRKSRAFEARPENRVFGYRLGADLDDLLQQAVDEYKTQGLRATKSDILRAWALAGRDLWEADQVEVMVTSMKAGGRKRISEPQADD